MRYDRLGIKIDGEVYPALSREHKPKESIKVFIFGYYLSDTALKKINMDDNQAINEYIIPLDYESIVAPPTLIFKYSHAVRNLRAKVPSAINCSSWHFSTSFFRNLITHLDSHLGVIHIKASRSLIALDGVPVSVKDDFEYQARVNYYHSSNVLLDDFTIETITNIQ